jgi:hypothetical protein
MIVNNKITYKKIIKDHQEKDMKKIKETYKKIIKDHQEKNMKKIK